MLPNQCFTGVRGGATLGPLFFAEGPLFDEVRKF